MVILRDKQIKEVYDKVNEIVKILNEIGIESKPQTVDGICESLDFLRVLVKYERFDVEACRRTIKSLRDIVAKFKREDNRKRKDGNDEDS